MSEEKLFTAKVDKELLDAFRRACASQDITASKAVRDYMRDYATKHGQAQLFPINKRKKKD